LARALPAGLSGCFQAPAGQGEHVDQPARSAGDASGAQENVELALKETLTSQEVADTRRRYDDAAGL